MNSPFHDIGMKEVEKTETSELPLYKVIILNDDVTPMDFVVGLIEAVFHKSRTEAFNLMREIHAEGSAVCAVYPLQLAETKVEEVKMISAQNSFPLKAIMEEDE